MAFESGANWTVGKGRGYFDRRTRGGVYEGERDLGNIASMSVSVGMDKRNHMNTKGDFRYTDKSAVVQISPKITVTLDEINVENLALLFLADVSEREQAATGDETLTIAAARVRPGFVIDLGGRFIDPEGFSVTGAGGTEYREGADWKLDARCGKLHVLKGGALDGAEDLTVTYRLKAQAYKRLDNFRRSTIEGRFTYVSDNAAGDNFIIECWNVSFILAGEAVFVTDRKELMRIQLVGDIQADEAWHPGSPFGKTTVIGQ